jgi:cytosine/adenosine deaminase-related metal-dependent hydrolase
VYKPDRFEETYKAGVFFDPHALATERRTNGGPYRELARRAKPKEAVALHGQLLTPDGVKRGYLVIDGDHIADVRTTKPTGVAVRETDGVILPGLIDMHNHPEFNIFAAWEPPEQFANRYRWRGSEIYHQLVRDPQNKLLTELPLRTETRYAEIRAIVGGVTAIQGASGKDRSREEALVRNVDLQIFGERHAQAMIDLPSKSGRDFDKLQTVLKAIESKDVKAFYLHLAEGRPDDKRSMNEFPRLKELKALTSATVLIHGTALTKDQLGEVKDAGAKLVWSPQSNLRLYGVTTLAHEALNMKLPIALGADWLPSGSQSLLAEMKVARQWLHEQKFDIEPRKLVEMVTQDAAEIAGLGDKLGKLEPGRPADVLVLETRIKDDPYENVCQADPSWVELVMVGGDLAYGRQDWIRDMVPGDQQADLELEIAWGKEMLLDTSYAVKPDDGPRPRLKDLRAALIASYPAIGPIWA